MIVIFGSSRGIQISLENKKKTAKFSADVPLHVYFVQRKMGDNDFSFTVLKQ